VNFFNDIDYRLSGTANNLKEKLERIHSFYTFEEEREHGILAIKIQLL